MGEGIGWGSIEEGGGGGVTGGPWRTGRENIVDGLLIGFSVSWHLAGPFGEGAVLGDVGDGTSKKDWRV